MSLDWKGDSKVWLLTAYEKDAAAGTTMNTASNDAKGDTTRLDGGTAASVPAQGADANPDILYSQSAKPVTNPTAVKMRRAMVQRTVDALAKGWAKAPNVTVVDSMQDERVPEAVRKADEVQRSQGAMGEPEGFWYRGQVYLVASALPTSADAARVLYHEVLGHHGLRGHFGKDLDRVLDQVIKLRRKDVQAKAQEYGLDMGNPVHAGHAAEEVLAELAQTRPDLGFVQRAIAAIRNFLRAHVPGFKTLELTDADIVQGYLLPARGWVERGADAGSAADGPMLSRSGNADTEAQRQFKETERAYGGKAAYERAKAAGKTKLTYGQWVQVRTPNFKVWFGDWEAVRAQERLDAMEPVQVRVPDAWRDLGQGAAGRASGCHCRPAWCQVRRQGAQAPTGSVGEVGTQEADCVCGEVQGRAGARASSQSGPRAGAARFEAARAVEDIYDTGTMLGLALSHDFAARQRVTKFITRSRHQGPGWGRSAP